MQNQIILELSCFVGKKFSQCKIDIIEYVKEKLSTLKSSKKGKGQDSLNQSDEENHIHRY